MTAIAAVEGLGDTKVIVLHGWALDSSVWLASRALSDVSRFTYAYVDFPGYGSNKDAPLAEGLDGMARVGLDVAESLGWDEFALLGHSMGGATALRIATLAPDRVTSVAAVTPASPAGTPLDPESYAGFSAAWADPGAAIQGALAPKIAIDDLHRLVARNRASMSQAAWEKYLANWSRSPSFMAEVSSYDGPVALFYGETDPFVTPEYLSQTASALRRGHTRMLPGAGHYPMVEAPAASVGLWEAALK
jgi:pimeloyl-ACP methyl ester carboxylesterase